MFIWIYNIRFLVCLYILYILIKCPEINRTTMFPELNEAKKKKQFPHESQIKNKINKNSTNLLGKIFFK